MAGSGSCPDGRRHTPTQDDGCQFSFFLLPKTRSRLPFAHERKRSRKEPEVFSLSPCTLEDFPPERKMTGKKESFLRVRAGEERRDRAFWGCVTRLFPSACLCLPPASTLVSPRSEVRSAPPTQPCTQRKKKFLNGPTAKKTFDP